jgi:hypothetical protein
MTDSTSRAEMRTVTAGALLLASGLAINYLLERYNVFKVWENSRYPIAWADLFYPPLCVFLSLTGIVLGVGGAIYRLPIRCLHRPALAIVIPLTVLYTLFAFALQFVQTGADRLGECPGLDQAASNSNAIPPSKVSPDHAAVGCGVERRGILLSFYNDMSVYGVTDLAAQQRVLERVAEHYRQAHTHPVQVMFYEEENWSVRQGKNGVTFGSRGSEKLIRVASVG